MNRLLFIIIKDCRKKVTKGNKSNFCIDNNAICGIIYPVENFRRKEE